MKLKQLSFVRFAAVCSLVMGMVSSAQAQPAAVAVPVAAALPVPTALQDYIARPDNSFAWKLTDKQEGATGRVYDVALTSQTWQDMPWKHDLVVFEPAQLKHPEHVLLFITGGSSQSQLRPDDRLLGTSLATLCGMRVALLPQVPNQPLLGGRTEDDLITDTFLFYLATNDARWPLLFPMVKSAVRAMDCVEQLAAQEWKSPVKGFVVTGASKRGWTTWLSAVADKRVRGIAPIVIDTLNMPKQMAYQFETWGKYSEQIDDYERKGLIQRLKDEPDFPLWKWVDPWTYRQQLTLPKLIVNGTNDRYWTVDALNKYWDDLPGSKQIRYVPNAGHNLKGGREGAIASIAAFTRHVASDKAMPALKWQHETEGHILRLTVESDAAPDEVLLWTAAAPTKDFREAQWSSQKLKRTEGRYVGEVPLLPGSHRALFGEAQYRFDGLDYSLSTQLRRE